MGFNFGEKNDKYSLETKEKVGKAIFARNINVVLYITAFIFLFWGMFNFNVIFYILFIAVISFTFFVPLFFGFNNFKTYQIYLRLGKRNTLKTLYDVFSFELGSHEKNEAYEFVKKFLSKHKKKTAEKVLVFSGNPEIYFNDERIKKEVEEKKLSLSFQVFSRDVPLPKGITGIQVFLKDYQRGDFDYEHIGNNYELVVLREKIPQKYKSSAKLINKEILPNMDEIDKDYKFRDEFHRKFGILPENEKKYFDSMKKFDSESRLATKKFKKILDQNPMMAYQLYGAPKIAGDIADISNVMIDGELLNKGEIVSYREEFVYYVGNRHFRFEELVRNFVSFEMNPNSQYAYKENPSLPLIDEVLKKKWDNFVKDKDFLFELSGDDRYDIVFIFADKKDPTKISFKVRPENMVSTEILWERH